MIKAKEEPAASLSVASQSPVCAGRLLAGQSEGKVVRGEDKCSSVYQPQQLPNSEKPQRQRKSESELEHKGNQRVDAKEDKCKIHCFGRQPSEFSLPTDHILTLVLRWVLTHQVPPLCQLLTRGERGVRARHHIFEKCRKYVTTNCNPNPNHDLKP